MARGWNEVTLKVFSSLSHSMVVRVDTGGKTVLKHPGIPLKVFYCEDSVHFCLANSRSLSNMTGEM